MLGLIKKFALNLLIAGILAAVLSMPAVAARPAVDTCVAFTPYGERYLVVIGNPEHAQAIGEDADCYASNPEQPRYWVVESPRAGEARSVIPVEGVSQKTLEMMMDAPGYAR